MNEIEDLYRRRRDRAHGLLRRKARFTGADLAAAATAKDIRKLSAAQARALGHRIAGDLVGRGLCRQIGETHILEWVKRMT